MDIYKNEETGKKFYVFDRAAGCEDSISATAKVLKTGKSNLAVMDGWIKNDELLLEPYKGYKKVIVIASKGKMLDKILKEAKA